MNKHVNDNRFTITDAIAKDSAAAVQAAWQGMSVILASGSPRRREVLELLGIDIQVVKPVVDESPMVGISPAEFAETVAKRKADKVRADYLDQPVIAADTIVVLGDRIFGKPCDADQAVEMLGTLRGRQHSVITAVCVAPGSGQEMICSHEETRVFFRDFSDGELVRYVESGEPLDKAGSYGIQGMGSILVERIEGELDNVIGFPLNCLAKLLSNRTYVRSRP